MKHFLIAAIALSVGLSMSAESGFAAAPKPDDASYLRSLAYLQSRGFLQSTDAWAAAPDVTLTKLDFLTLVVRRVYPLDRGHCLTELGPYPEATYTHLFRDVPRTAPRATVVCVALQAGLVSGHRDGTLRPGDAVTLAEASKILVKAYSLAYPRVLRRHEPWYSPYIYDLRNRGGVPAYLQDAGTVLTRRDIAAMLYGLRQRDMRLLTQMQLFQSQPDKKLEARPRRLEQRPLRRR